MNRFDGNYKLSILILILMTFTPVSLISAVVMAATVESQFIEPGKNAATMLTPPPIVATIICKMNNIIVTDSCISSGECYIN